MKVVLRLLGLWALFLLGSLFGVLMASLALASVGMQSRAYLDGERESPPSTLLAVAMRPVMWLATQQPAVDALGIVPGLSWIPEMADDLDSGYGAGLSIIDGGLRVLETVRERDVFSAPRQLDEGVLKDVLVEMDRLQHTADSIPDFRDTIDRLPSLMRPDGLGDQLSRAQRVGEAGIAGVRALTTQLLQDEPTQVFVAITNPAEKRGTHGIIGQYAAFEVDGGTITLAASGPNTDLVDPPTLAQGLSQGYATFFGDSNVEWVNMTMSPFAPDAALQMAMAWELMGNTKPDVVVFADTFALASLAESAESTLAGVNGEALDSAETIANYLSNGIYFDFPEDNLARKEFQSTLEASIIEQVIQGSVDVERIARSMFRHLDEGRVALWFDDEALQDMIVDTSISGSPQSTDADQIVLSFNNLTGNKMDFYIEPTVEVRECGDGAVVRVILRNTASAANEYPDYVTRRLDLGADEYRPGVVLAVTVVVGALSFRDISSGMWSRTRDQAFGLAGLPAFQHVVEIGFGQESAIELSFADSRAPRTVVHPFARPHGVQRERCSP